MTTQGSENPGWALPQQVKQGLSCAPVVIGLVAVVILFIFLAIHAFVSLERTIDDDDDRVVYQPVPTVSADVTGAEETPPKHARMTVL